MTSIHYLQRKDIDTTKWDSCITNAGNGLIYGYSFYLDTMAKNRDALVLNDYEAVMPLVWNKKFGFYYLYTPVFTCPLAVFGKNITPQLIENFLHHIPKHFKLWDISLNMDINPSVTSLKVKKRQNHILALSGSYDSLLQKFRTSYKQIIKKGAEAGYTIKKDIAPEPIIELSVKKMLYTTRISKDDFSRFQTVFYEVKKQLRASTYGLYSADNRLLASGIFFFSHNRAYYMLAGNTDEGRTAGASHQVIHAFIKDHAGENMILDFEGSDVPEIAFFFEGFGATKEIYTHLHLNRLPFPLKYFK